MLKRLGTAALGHSLLTNAQNSGDKAQMLPDSVGALGLDAEVLSMVLGKELGETTLSALGSCCLCNNACLCNSSSKTNAVNSVFTFHFFSQERKSSDFFQLSKTGTEVGLS